MGLPSIYRLLFGRDHLRDGDVIGLAEHGRTGGVDTGQGFKFVSIAGEAVSVQEDSVDSNITYVGRAEIGASTADSVWQIKRINTTTGTVIDWADSNAEYDNIFDNRESLSYG